jgi:hypothetical protein
VANDQGACAIIYSARLQWGPVRLGYAATLHLPAGEAGAPREAATLRKVEPPRAVHHEFSWSNSPLGASATWQRDAPPITRCLAQSPEGEIDWACHLPRARARVQIHDARLEGLGYLERLRLTVRPWKLPFRALRWGRHLSAEHSLVWIDWRGGEERCWVWLDGAEQPGAAVHDDGVAGLEGGAELRWTGGRDLRDRRLLARWHEHKRLSPSGITMRGRSLDRGWTVHEVVTW